MLALLGADQNYWSLRRLDLPLRFALSLPLIMLFTRLRLSAPCLVLACAVGGMCAGLLGVYQYVIEGLRPVEGMAGHRILFGCLAALLGVFGFCAITESRRFTHKVCGLLGFVGAWAAIGSSESRAALVTYSLLIVLIFMFWIRKVKRVYLLAAFVALSVALVAAYHAKLFQVDVRIHEGFAQIHEYYEVENTASSLGARFEMWFAARLLFAESPLLGKGPRTFLPESQRLVRTEQVRPFGDGYKHAHNQYLDSLASTGIFGLFSLLFALWVPLGLFVRYLFDSDPEVKTFSMIGILLCVGWLSVDIGESIYDQLRHFCRGGRSATRIRNRCCFGLAVFES
ncbi:MAG: O-antigen ligase family protein, partial [Gammaproteobacteria bacterium]